MTLTDDEGATATGTVDVEVVPAGPNRLPVASIGVFPAEPDASDLIEFTGTWMDDGRIVRAEWDFDGIAGFEVDEVVPRGELGNEQDIRLPAGERDVTFRVTDDSGGQATALVHLAVGPANQSPTAVLSIPSVPGGFHVDQLITLDAREVV